jgi:hypothetical protein
LKECRKASILVKETLVGDSDGRLSQYNLDSKRNKSNSMDGLVAIKALTCAVDEVDLV